MSNSDDQELDPARQWRPCPHCEGSGRDPTDTRPRCRSRRGLMDNKRCDYPAGHNQIHFHFSPSGGSTGWSTDEKDCACGKRVMHPGKCAEDVL